MQDPTQHATKAWYNKLVVELSIDFVTMYLVTYTMIAILDHFYLSIQNVHITLLIVAPMAVVLLIGVRSMFPSRRVNLMICAAAVVAFIASFVAVRAQAAAGNDHFLRSMIHQHSGAVLMCEQSAITDQEIRALCDQIVKSQQEEIAQLQALLKRY